MPYNVLMSYANSAGEKILGIPVEEIPERCRECPVLHECAAKHPDLDITNWHPHPGRATIKMKLVSMAFARMGNRCPGGITENGHCGSEAKVL